jgi:hypothetical protein
MRIRIALAGAVLAALALALSCATQPPAALSEPSPPPPAAAAAPAPAAVAPEAPAPDKQKAEAAELRKRAFDLGIKDALPAEYAAADQAYALGLEKYGKDNAASAAAFADAIAGFRGAIERGLPILAASEGDKARAAETAAIRKGAASWFYDESDSSSSALAAAGAVEAAGEYEKAIAAYRAAADRFTAIGAMCDAAATRDAIAARDFAKWDPSNWTIAEGKLAVARGLVEPDSKASLVAADEAVLRYKLVMQNGLSYHMSDRKTLSEAERERASGIKAEVAVKDEYAAAQALYENAESERTAEDFESASILYDEAASAFAAAYDGAKVKMDSAQSEIDSLDAALEAAAR